jgi:hypothetical protein
MNLTKFVLIAMTFASFAQAGDVGNGENGLVVLNHKSGEVVPSTQLTDPITVSQYSCVVTTRTPFTVSMKGGSVNLNGKVVKQTLREVLKDYSWGMKLHCSAKIAHHASVEGLLGPGSPELMIPNDIPFPVTEIRAGSEFYPFITIRNQIESLCNDFGNRQEVCNRLESAYKAFGLDETHPEYKVGFSDLKRSEREAFIKRLAELMEAHFAPQFTWVRFTLDHPVVQFDWSGGEKQEFVAPTHASLIVGGLLQGGKPSSWRDKFPIELSSAGEEQRRQLNHYMSQKGEDEVYHQLYDRPSAMSYLYFYDEDAQALQKAKSELIDMLAPFENTSCLYHDAYQAIFNQVADRFTKTACNFLQVTNGLHPNDVWYYRRLLLGILKVTGSYIHGQVDEADKYPKYDVCQTRATAASELDLMGRRNASLANAQTVLNSLMPSVSDPRDLSKLARIPRLSKEGCVVIPRIIEIVGTFYADYVSYFPKVATDDRFSPTQYVGAIRNEMAHLQSALGYQNETPEQFITRTLPEWQTVCDGGEKDSIRKELDKYRKPNPVAK